MLGALTTWAGEGAALIEDGAVKAWEFVHPFLTALEPSAWAQALPIITEAIEDVADGDLADLETAVLNKAEGLGVTLFKDLDSAVVQALIAAVKAFRPAAA